MTDLHKVNDKVMEMADTLMDMTAETVAVEGVTVVDCFPCKAARLVTLSDGEYKVTMTITIEKRA